MAIHADELLPILSACAAEERANSVQFRPIYSVMANSPEACLCFLEYHGMEDCVVDTGETGFKCWMGGEEVFPGDTGEKVSTVLCDDARGWFKVIE